MNTTPDFTIRRLNVIDGKENQIGNRLLASFDLETTGIIVTGCVLILKADGTITAKGPMGKNHNGDKISAHFAGEGLAEAVRDRARQIYELFTGREIAAQ